MSKKITIDGVTCLLEENSVILKGHQVISLKEAKAFFKELKEASEYGYIRSAGSWTGQFVISRIGRVFGKFSIRVKDLELSDLDFVINQLLYDLVYGIYSICYWICRLEKPRRRKR